MRKERGKYKRCGRLGYNARLRVWTGKKKKWAKQGRFYKDEYKIPGHIEGGEKRPRNPVSLLKNESRRGVTRRGHSISISSERSSIDAKSDDYQKEMMITNLIGRRKDTHKEIRDQKRGRKRRYGGVKRDGIKKGIREETDSYKKDKEKIESDYRYGRREDREGGKANNNEEGKYSSYATGKHRRWKTELRSDRRRWRSGRVKTLQRARDLIEHGKVLKVDEEGKERKEVRWQGGRVKVGHGRKIKEEVWKKRKKIETEDREKKGEENVKVGINYREVDYITGLRVVLRKVGGNEVRIPEGIELKDWKQW